MNVVLLSYTPEPELNIANAARLCYSGATIDEVREKSHAGKDRGVS